MIKPLIRQLQLSVKHLSQRRLNSSLKRSFKHEKVPYFCQWETRELAKDLLDGTKHTDDDPNWKKSGAQTKEEYHDWSWSGCGMACLKMILAHAKGTTVPLVTLGKQCLSYGGYREPLADHPGLFYKPFVTFVGSEYNLKAQINSTLSLTDLCRALEVGNYIVCSVNPAIRNPESSVRQRSGHLILVLGYDLDKEVFWLHNPSGTSVATQEYAEISFKDFQRFFGNKGIVIQA